MHLQVFGAKKSYNFIVLGTFCQIKGYFYNQQETKGFFQIPFKIKFTLSLCMNAHLQHVKITLKTFQNINKF